MNSSVPLYFSSFFVKTALQKNKNKNNNNSEMFTLAKLNRDRRYIYPSKERVIGKGTSDKISTG